MLKPPPTRPWTCTRCLRHESRRRLATATASSPAAPPSPPVSHRDPPSSHQDRTLRQIFDSQPFWKDFSQASASTSSKPAGLFQNRYLTKPEGFEHFASVTLAKCKRIVTKVLAYDSVDQYKSIAKDLDRLSDLLCRVIDLCDFVRSTHPKRNMQLAATQAYAQMFEYMNVLNTTTGLNDQLKTALSLPEVTQSWSVEELTVANILARDFAKSAIDLPDVHRQAFVELSNTISEVGPEFVDNMASATPLLNLPSSKLKGMDPLVVRELTRWGSVTLPSLGMPASLALRTVEDADTRRDIYMANRTSAKQNIDRLERLLRQRAELARLSGHDSYAHMALSDKMAKSPEAVVKFLDALAADNAPIVQNEVQEMLDLKKSDARLGNFADQLNPWDRDYYQHRILNSMRSKQRTPDVLSAYFSLGTVMQGLSRLFHNLYGIRLVPKEAQPGETWNNDVRRLDVIDDQEGHVAVIYCDLFERAGKSPNPAHFTLRCSRRILPDELEEAEALRNATGQLFATAQEAATDGLAVNKSRRDNNHIYQLPTIALICDFAIPQAANIKRPALLTFREVQTLFHEMGHALHSICGRTALQNVSGTRCATDFAELPSVLMEHFASAPEVLALYARHWETDAPLDPSRVLARINLDTHSQGTETEAQLLLAMLDQNYHSSLPLSPSFDSTKTYHDVWNRYSSIPEPAGTCWQGFFGHLYGYGATYYSYLFDRAIAGKIWKDVFRRVGGKGAVDPEAGARFRDEVLRHGGGRDGWHCVAGVLGEEQGGKLAEGGEEAMGMVGKWGVGD